MTKITYIKNNYPATTTEQLKVPEIIDSESIYIEAQKWNEKSELTNLFTQLQKSDTLILYSLQALFCIKDYLYYLIELNEKNIHLKTVVEQIDTKRDLTFYNNVIDVINIQEKCAWDQSSRNSECRKKQGIVIGRPKVSEQKIEKIQSLRWYEKLSYRDISRECDVALGTVQKYANDKILKEVFL